MNNTIFFLLGCSLHMRVRLFSCMTVVMTVGGLSSLNRD
jgi:hypothetical protein